MLSNQAIGVVRTTIRLKARGRRRKRPLRHKAQPPESPRSCPNRSPPDIVDESSELPQPYFEPVQEAGRAVEFAGQDHEPDEDRGPAGTWQGGEHQAAEGDDGADGDQEDPPYEVALFVLPSAMVTVLEAFSWLALSELSPVLL